MGAESVAIGPVYIRNKIIVKEDERKKSEGERGEGKGIMILRKKHYDILSYFILSNLILSYYILYF